MPSPTRDIVSGLAHANMHILGLPNMIYFSIYFIYIYILVYILPVGTISNFIVFFTDNPH